MENLHICFAKIDYKCPFCNAVKVDSDDILLMRANKNKCGYTKVKCECGKTFGFTYNYKGDATAFIL